MLLSTGVWDNSVRWEIKFVNRIPCQSSYANGGIDSLTTTRVLTDEIQENDTQLEHIRRHIIPVCVCHRSAISRRDDDVDEFTDRVQLDQRKRRIINTSGA